METIGLMNEQPMCQNPLALQQLKRIWRECFEADDGYLDAYFSIGYRPEQTLVFQDDDTILGMLTLLPCQYRGIHQGKVRLYKAAYLFAVGTLPQAQGRQIASKLLGAADDVLKKQGVELALLAPAEPSLYHFYQKRGYESFFTRRELFFEPKGRAEHLDTRTLSLKPVSLSEYYPKHINRIPQESILWDEQTLCFAERESILYGGGLYVLMDGQNELCICNIYRYKEEEVIVKELLLQQGVSQQQAIEALRDLFLQCRVTIRLTGTDKENRVPSGMIRFYGPKEDMPENTQMAYLPFLLD